MHLTRVEVENYFNNWLIAWNNHDLEGVLSLIHDDIVFENWNGNVVAGKTALQKAWLPWFFRHGNFKFIKEDIFFDEPEQKMTFLWCLEWPSLEKFFKGKHEIRRGSDILYFLDGKIIKKYTYSKTNLQINSGIILLEAPKISLQD